MRRDRTCHLFGLSALLVVKLFTSSLNTQRYLSQMNASFPFMPTTDNDGVVKLILNACIPVEERWIQHGSLIYVVSNCSNVDSLLPANTTVIQHHDNERIQHLVCVMSENAASSCLQEALLNAPSTVVYPTHHHSLAPATIANVTLIPIHAMTTIMPVTWPSKNDSNVVLHLPCNSQTDLLAVTYHIPTYTRELVLLYECENGVFLRNKNKLLRNTTAVLSDLYPLTNISTQTCSAGNCLTTLLSAERLICLSWSCLIPSLMSPNEVTLVMEQSPLLGFLEEANSNLEVVSPSTPSSSCRHVQGRLGQWHFDESYHNQHFHNGTKWMTPERELPDFYRSNKFVWQDNYCPLQLFSRGKFCKAMQRLGFSRLFILGDSLQFMAAIALFRQLGYHDDNMTIHDHMKLTHRMRSSQTLTCSSSFSIEIIFHRYNHLWPNYATDTSGYGNQEAQNKAARRFVRGQKYDAKVFEYFQCIGGITNRIYPDEQGYCPWVHDYLNSTRKTLFWANAGAHFHHLDFFTKSVEYFEGFLRNSSRPDDWFILRTLHPGHDKCEDEIEPYVSFQEYRRKGFTNKFDWNLFVNYNRQMEELAWRSRRQGAAVVDIQDVYWTTALRKDGHPSRDDCLHYYLPGPPDWWVHSLYSMIEDKVLDQGNTK